jgi:hypothetical protein
VLTATRTPGRLLGAALAVLLLGTLAAPAGAARRADPGGSCPPGQENCDVWDDDPGTGTPGGGGDGGDDGGGDGGGGGGPARCQWNGRPLPCYDSVLGHFNNGDGCYYKLAEPQPADTPAGKQWYVATCNGGDLGSQRTVLLDGPPPGFDAPPDPEELARRALASITLKKPLLAVAPRKSVGPGLVGLPVWLWTSRRPAYWGALTAEASERGLTVEISAAVDRIVWKMGNGDTVECTKPGTPYDPDGSHAGEASPDCGYADGYPHPGTYRITATTYWTVTWSASSGASGTISQTRTGGVVEIQINELQVVTQ